MGNANANFIKLELDEVINKLMALAKSKETLKIWEKKKDAQIYRISECQQLNIEGVKTAVLTLFSEGAEIDSQIADKRAFIGFESNEIDYFTEGDVAIDPDTGEVLVRLDRDIYRSEKRVNERLLTFPHHQVYAYFQIGMNTSLGENVVAFKRREDEIYENYKNKKKADLLKELEKKIDDVSDLMGFRAIDISNSGIAFLVGADERDFFRKGVSYDFLVMFNGEIINLSNGKLIYNIDFIGVGSKSEPKFKVGIQFLPNPKLTETIQSILKQSSSLDRIKSEFENFIDE